MATKAGWIDDRTALHAALRSDFSLFVRKVFAELCPGVTFSNAPYLGAIAYQLERVSCGDITRLIVTVPPRHLKSIAISIARVAWSLGHTPELRFLSVSYSMDLAAKLSRDCRQVMQSAWYRELFPKTVLRKWIDTTLETTAGGGRLATSIGGSLTGFGADVIIIDDPMKADEAMSASARQKVQEWVTTTLFSRLNDQRSGAIVLVMQRLHEDDFAGYLLERGGWSHLKLPAICEERQDIPLIGGKTYERLPGDVLDPERQPLAILEQIKRELGGHNFSAQFQQAPAPADGTLVKREWLKSCEDAPKRKLGDFIVQSWDPACKPGDDNDYSACVTLLVCKNTVYVLNVFRGKLDFPGLLRMVDEQNQLFSPDVLLIEDAASGQQLIQMLHNGAVSGVPTPIGCKPDGDKIVRLSACTPLIERGDLVLPTDAPWLIDFERELLGFPRAKHDDQVDALSQALTWIRNRPKVLNCLPAVLIDNPRPWADETCELDRRWADLDEVDVTMPRRGNFSDARWY